MRFLTGFALLTAALLLAGCGASPDIGGTAEPAAVVAPSPPVAPLPAATPLPTVALLPAPTPLPTAALLPVVTPLPTVAPLLPATPLPTPTPLPTIAPLPAATGLPPATVVPTPTPTALPTATPDLSEAPLVTIGQFTWPVELALTWQQQAQGLSGREELAAGFGMLFVWDYESRRSFWMPDMNFPLDLVWIDGDCVVAQITPEAPPQAPGQSREELPRYTVDWIQYVLEINAGEAAQYGIKVGDQVRFQGSLAGEYGC